MPLDLDPHKSRKDSNGRLVLSEVRPYIRLNYSGEAPLFIQGGQVYPDGRDAPAIPQKQLPEWFWEQVNNLTDAGLKKVGFKIPPDRVREG